MLNGLQNPQALKCHFCVESGGEVASWSAATALSSSSQIVTSSSMGRAAIVFCWAGAEVTTVWVAIKDKDESFAGDDSDARCYQEENDQ